MLEKMKEIIADQLGVSEEEVTLEASFKEDLDADSLDLFEVQLKVYKPDSTDLLFKGTRVVPLKFE